MFVRESVSICLFGFFHLPASKAMKGNVLYVQFSTQLFQLDQEGQEWKQKHKFFQFSLCVSCAMCICVFVSRTTSNAVQRRLMAVCDIDLRSANN